MEEIENFYLKIIAELKILQTERLSKERMLPFKLDVHEKKIETLKARILCKKAEKQRQRLENGYIKGVQDTIKRVTKIYKEYMKCALRD